MDSGEGPLRRMLFNALTGKCTCGREKNQQGKVCCRKCPNGHSGLCDRRSAR